LDLKRRNPIKRAGGPALAIRQSIINFVAAEKIETLEDSRRNLRGEARGVMEISRVKTSRRQRSVLIREHLSNLCLAIFVNVRSRKLGA
jgi:hypothetical protein